MILQEKIQAEIDKAKKQLAAEGLGGNYVHPFTLSAEAGILILEGLVALIVTLKYLSTPGSSAWAQPRNKR